MKWWVDDIGNRAEHFGRTVPSGPARDTLGAGPVTGRADQHGHGSWVIGT